MNNKKSRWGLYCPHCYFYLSDYDECLYTDDDGQHRCIVIDAHEKPSMDAVEFEARVVEKLSRYVNMESWPNLWPECISCKDHRKYDDEACPPCVLKHTRIEVEKEMENG